jgi:ATP-dependent helicase/nuclease subunit A
MKQTAPLPSDHEIRKLFATELEHNFSVIAPAGVGKTAAIVDRVITIATQDRARALVWLPKLVVVTYTNRAADEMQQRARNRILERKVDLTVLGAFNRAFFGTIHSFCLKLLQRHGYHLGLPGQIGLVEDEDALWLEFVRQLDDVGGELSESTRRRLFRHVSMLEVIELARRINPGRLDVPANEPWPALDFASVLSCPPNNRSKNSVERGQQALREWLKALEGDATFLPLPSFEKGGAEFQTRWCVAFAPLRRWLGERALVVAHDVAVKFREYRVNQGQLTYDDQLALAAELMRHPDAGKEIRAEQYRVILDEAQDTDPVQFEVLLAVAASAPDKLPRPGHFSMVGDPQQSIYGERADLEHYREVHRQLTGAGVGEELTFDVTFRCDRSIVDSVNKLAPAMLDNTDGQVRFVTLTPRPQATAGQVARWLARRDPEVDKKYPKGPPDRALGWVEAHQLAKWLKNAGLKKLRAPDWSEVAILCPRKRWFGSLRDALTKVGIPVQVQSHQDVNGDSAAYAWFTALLVVATEPRNSFEVVGVLREVFGLSDQALADFSNGDGPRFQIESETKGRGDVAETLTLLARTRVEAVTLPLRDGVLKLVEVVSLRERLRTLDDGKEFEAELSDLLVRTAVAEADGLSLAVWADKLRREFEDVREGEPVRRGAIQLITCQKAKGLEWHVVVLPFLFRKLKGRPKEYPLVIEGANEQPLAAFESADISDEVGGRLRRRAEQEYQRVLYVAMTRAKRTLVVVDDSALFESKPDAKDKSFAQLLGVADGANSEAWKRLPGELSAEATTASEPVEIERGVGEGLPAITASRIGEAVERARQFHVRVLPHRLAKSWTTEEPETRGDGEGELPATTERSPAVRYGIWWHDQMKSIDWQSDPEGWTKTFTARAAPEHYRERAEKEWALFRKSELAKLLSERHFVVHAEMPVLWKQNDGSCVEGFVDLAAFDPESKEWLIVDWKTDVVKPFEAGKLEEEYAGQLQAYVKAVCAISGLSVKGSLYSTSTGKWIRIS